MKSLLILKGLAKTEKQKWIKSEKLENYFLDISDFRKLYSAPELIKPGIEALGRSYGTLVYQRFIEALIIRLGKGCLVIVDLDEDPVVNIENLAMIHGYTIFYKVFPVPQDYCNFPKKYNLSWQICKKKDELEISVKNFLNLQLGDKLVINKYDDILNYWINKEVIINLDKDDPIIHVSDIHSNYSLWKKEVKPLDNKVIVHHGDYIDGPELDGSIKIITEIVKDNETHGWYWLEGNHEIRLRRFLGWILLKAAGSKTTADLLYSMIPEDFLNTTSKEFERLTPKEARFWLLELNKKLKTHIIINRGRNTFICTHSGIKLIEQLNPKHIGNVVYGNRDIDSYDKQFSNLNKRSNYISVHAHCKYPKGWNTEKYDRVYNIDPENEKSIVIFNNQRNKKDFKVCQKLQ